MTTGILAPQKVCEADDTQQAAEARELGRERLGGGRVSFGDVFRDEQEHRVGMVRQHVGHQPRQALPHLAPLYTVPQCMKTIALIACANGHHASNSRHEQLAKSHCC